MNKTKRFIEEKGATLTSSVSGAMSFLGGYQVCHNVCLGIIALLSVIGITVVGMPLLFLQKVAVPFWILAFVLFLISLVFYFGKGCISRNLLIFNSGVLIAGIPFGFVQPYISLFWIVGGAFVLISVVLFVRKKLRWK